MLIRGSGPPRRFAVTVMVLIAALGCGLIAAVLPAAAQTSPAAAQTSTEFEAIRAAADEGPEAIPSMVFGERSLDDIVALADRVENGGAPPWSLFRAAQAAERRGDRTDAADALGAVLDLPGTGSGVALWTWSNLRRLGFEPAASLADQVQGVVYETPTRSGIEYLAVYADGRWRILDTGGRGIFWEDTDDPDTRALTAAILTAAQRLTFWADNTPARDRRELTAARVTLLTWAGMRQIPLTGPRSAEGSAVRAALDALAVEVERLRDFATAAATKPAG